VATEVEDPLAARGVIQTVQRRGPERRSPPRSLALLPLILALAHLAIAPGTLVDGQRYGWNGSLSLLGDLPLLVTWPLGLLVLATAMVCYVLGSLRPLGLPLGPIYLVALDPWRRRHIRYRLCAGLARSRPQSRWPV
jgi:hypothetical protein